MGLGEAISRDESSQLLKVFGTKYLLYLVKFMCWCTEVFATWDDVEDQDGTLVGDLVDLEISTLQVWDQDQELQ